MPGPVRHIVMWRLRGDTPMERADARAKTGQVQELIGICQAREVGFEKFILRAKQGEN